MWTKEKLEEAAREYRKSFEGFHVTYRDIEWAFIDGCEYIINNTQKTNESKIQETE